MKPLELRERLLLQSIEIIEEQGHDTLTLRELGTRAGVSRQAPYLHFESRQALLAAVACEVMQRERLHLQASVNEAGSDPSARLHALAMAHVRFLHMHPRLYEVVYGGAVKKAQTEALQAEAVRTFALLRDTVASCFPGASTNLIRRRCIVVWGAIRGIAELSLSEQVPASVPGKLKDWLGDAIDTLIKGWRSA